MVLSAQTSRRLQIVTPCKEAWHDKSGNSAGLSGCGYDVTLDLEGLNWISIEKQQFVLASTVERFNLPNNVVGIVHDKSSLARKGLAVQNTVLEPGWQGYLTLELSNHSAFSITLYRDIAIAQVIFHFLDEHTILPYAGKYQNQERGPQFSR